ncbi:MAG: aromatic hydrocarbon degradation protein [Flavobacteriaceae bacterium]|jgi:hypothetical protein|nr:aromatic hydrocarbon degradation protein [Flavobacteriaceae bacterium]
MKKTTVFIFLLLSAAAVKAQQTSTSPYSSFGMGDDRRNGDLIISSMGGIGTTYVSELGNEANFSNPAANRNLNYASFNVALTTDAVQSKTSDEKYSRSTSYLSNLSLAFPAGKNSRMGVILQPYTSVGYDIHIDNDTEKSLLTGRGGLHTAALMYSRNLNKELSLGAKVGYVWGELEKNEEIAVLNAPLINGTKNIQDFSFFDYTLGVTYQKKLKKDHKLTLGATYSLGHNTDTDVDFLRSTYYYNSQGVITSRDTLNYINGKRTTKIPSSYTVGVAYGKELKWALALEGKYIQQSAMKIPEDNAEYRDKYRIALGGWLLPNFNSFKSYFSRVIYRYGIYYENSGLMVNNHEINQWGVSVGAGFPIGKRGQGQSNPSMINIGIEAGQKGAKTYGLIKEDFVSLKIGFNFDDAFWFKKRKYD